MSKSIAFREGTAIAKMYETLKDGKRREYTAVAPRFRKMGVASPFALALRLCQSLRLHETGKMVSISKKHNYIQIVPFVSAGKTVSHTTKTKTKPTAKKPTKARTVKAVEASLVPAGHEEE